MQTIRKQTVIKLISILPAAVLGVLFNYIVITQYFYNIVGTNRIKQLILLAGQAAVFYVILQLILFRGKGWTRAEKIIGLAGYFAVLLMGLLFRYGIQDLSTSFRYWFVWRNFEWNPFSFVWDFMVDRGSLVIAAINLVLFIPLPILLSANHIKPRFWAALILFFAIELLQPALAQGVFSLGDILLYSVGFLIGLALLRLIRSRAKRVVSDPNLSESSDESVR